MLFLFLYFIIFIVIRFNQEHDLNNLDIDYMNDFVNQNQNSDFLTNQQDIKIQTTANNNSNSNNKNLSIQMQPPPPDIVMNSFERDNFFKKFTNKIGSYFLLLLLF